MWCHKQIDDVLRKFLEEQENEIVDSLKAKFPNIESNVVARTLDAFITNEGTKRPIPISRSGATYEVDREALSQLGDIDEEILQYTLNALEGSRLLRFGQDSIELAHDSLAVLIEDRREGVRK